MQSLRILFPTDGHDGGEGPSSPVVGIAEGGLHSAEGLLLARYFGGYSTSLEEHLSMTDSEVLSAMRARSRDPDSPGHEPARRVVQRDHFRRLYEPKPGDQELNLDPAVAVCNWAEVQFGRDSIRRIRKTKGPGARDFPVIKFDASVESSIALSRPLAHLPSALYDGVFIDSSAHDQAQRTLDREFSGILG